MKIKQSVMMSRLAPAGLLLLAVMLLPAAGRAGADPATMPGKKTITLEMRKAAAARAAERKKSAAPLAAARRAAAPAPGGAPDYFNYSNYANSPMPTVVSGAVTGGGIRKFIDTLPGVGAANANNLGQYIPIAVADNTTYPGSDYYRIGLVDYTQKMHSDLPPTKLRGYKDLAPSADGGAHYLGPLIIAQRGRPVRVKFTNSLGTGNAGKLFVPVDPTLMGAGMGPDGMNSYTENRATVHLHGGDSPWISDGTQHQWFVPAGEATPYKTGASKRNVPDMADPGDGSGTFFWPNQQSARLMFYHDHAFGLTRLNVYAGEAAGYLLKDTTEENLIDTGVLPDAGGVYHYGIPLVIQDKTFVDSTTIPAQDPTWNWGSTPGTARTGDLWYNHVYMPNQNPADPFGVNAMGRWDYGPWTWPPPVVAHGPDPDGTPGVPAVSAVPESYMDTPMVNGTAYPRLTLLRQPYRFRILNACNDRFLNLQLYYSDAGGTEVPMVPAVFNSAYPPTWPTDGRAGGVPDPAAAGPSIIQIGTEGGFLPGPVVIPPVPISSEELPYHSLLLGTAERADVIIDFSQVPLSVTHVILYNDMSAPVPGGDSRYDYYTGDQDQTAIGGATTTVAGYGPNTRTIMRFDLTGGIVSSFNLANLQAALPAAYAASRPQPIVPQAAYNTAFGAAYTDKFAKLTDNSLTFVPGGSALATTVQLKSKGLGGGFEPGYGRLVATLGTVGPAGQIPLANVDPATEILQNGETQIWKIVNTDMDVHPIHFHLFNVQVVNRVTWGGQITPPDANELGWKDTVRTPPGVDTIVALRPVASTFPFVVPDSIRLPNPTMPEGAAWNSLDPVTGNPVMLTNVMTNFGKEYVWHCHILGHEENDMMRPIIFRMSAPGSIEMASIFPDQASAGPQDVILNITGSGFAAGSTAMLTRAGKNAVLAASASVLSPTQMTATFHQPFAPGPWNVSVAGGGQTVTLPNALTLLSAASASTAKVFQGIFKPRQGEAARLVTSLAMAGGMSINVYDSLGRFIKEIFKGTRAAGNYVDSWDGTTSGNKLVASGEYLIHFKCPGFSVTKRVVVIK